jgi:hypothetical protein
MSNVRARGRVAAVLWYCKTFFLAGGGVINFSDKRSKIKGKVSALP